MFKPCENCGLIFQLFFLNLSSKVPAGVIVRTSKYLCVASVWYYHVLFSVMLKHTCPLIPITSSLHLRIQGSEMNGIHESLKKTHKIQPIKIFTKKTHIFRTTGFQIKGWKLGARRHKINYNFFSIGDPPRKLWQQCLQQIQLIHHIKDIRCL